MSRKLPKTHKSLQFERFMILMVWAIDLTTRRRTRLGWLTKASSMITAKSGSEVRGREGLKTFYAHVLLPYKCSSLNNFKIFIFFFPPGSSSPLLLNQWIVFTSFIHSNSSHHLWFWKLLKIFNLYFLKLSDFAIIWLLPEPFRKRSVN